MTDDLKERLRDRWLELSCASFDSQDAGISSNLVDETIDRIEALEASEAHWKERCRAASAEVGKLESHLAMAKKALYEADRDQDHER